MSRAEELMRSAEREGFSGLNHNEKFRDACRLLYSGKEYAHEWINTNFENYNQSVTEEQLTGILNQFPEDYS